MNPGFDGKRFYGPNFFVSAQMCNYARYKVLYQFPNPFFMCNFLECVGHCIEVPSTTIMDFID